MAKKQRRSAIRRWQQWLFWGISLLVVLSMVLAYVLIEAPPPPPPETPTPLSATR